MSNQPIPVGARERIEVTERCERTGQLLRTLLLDERTGTLTITDHQTGQTKVESL